MFTIVRQTHVSQEHLTSLVLLIRLGEGRNTKEEILL